MPACTAALKSTIHCKPASTVEPAGKPPPFGVRFTTNEGVIGLPRWRLPCPPAISTTVQASGKASAVAAFSHELLRSETAGNTGAGTGAVPLGVGAAGR